MKKAIKVKKATKPKIKTVERIVEKKVFIDVHIPASWTPTSRALPDYGRKVFVVADDTSIMDSVGVGYRSHTNSDGEHYVDLSGKPIRIVAWMNIPNFNKHAHYSF